MMALRKDPARRYASAEALSEDLFRHLEGLPVQARRGAWSYRANRFVLRHRVLFGAGMLANLALIVGLGVAVYQREEATRQREEATRQRERAQRHFASVRKLAHVFIYDIHDAIKGLAGSTPARKMVVDNALAYLQDLSAEAGGDVALQTEIAAGYSKVGDILGRPYVANLGDPEKAMSNYGKARALLEKLVGDSKNHDADFRRAQEELVATYQRQGVVLGSLGRFKEADAALRSGLVVATDLAAADPSNHLRQVRLGVMYAEQSQLLLDSGNFDRFVEVSDTAISFYQAALARVPDDPVALSSLAAIHNTRGNYFLTHEASAENAGKALAAYRESLSLERKLLQRNLDDAHRMRNVAMVQTNVGLALSVSGEPKQAAQELRSAIGFLSPLIAKDPDNVQVKMDQAGAYTGLSEALLNQDDPAGSADAERAALAIFENLPESARKETYVRMSLGEGRYTLGRALEGLATRRDHVKTQAAADHREACQAYRQALGILQEVKDRAGIAPAEVQPDTVRKALQRCLAGGRAAQ